MEIEMQKGGRMESEKYRLKGRMPLSWTAIRRILVRSLAAPIRSDEGVCCIVAICQTVTFLPTRDRMSFVR